MRGPMKNQGVSAAALLSLGMATLLAAAGYIAVRESQLTRGFARPGELAKITPGMPFEQVVAILGQPERRVDRKDAGGEDPGFFRAVWRSKSGPITIYFNAYQVSGIGRANDGSMTQQAETRGSVRQDGLPSGRLRGPIRL